MIAVDGRHIYINRGDTGGVKIKCSGYDFGDDDRCVFTLKAADGSVVLETINEIDDGEFEVYFLHNDTANLTPGDGYYWGITYYISAYYQDGKVVNGNVVYTPTKEPMPFTVWQTA